MICIPESRRPHKNGLKFIVPIFRDFDASLAINPTVFLNFNRTKANLFKGISGDYFVQKCGGSFDPIVEQEFQSPSYPNAYPSSTFCHWIFKRMNIDYESNSIPGYKLTFLEFDIGHNCDQDYFLLQMNPRYEWQGSERICANANSLPVPIYLTHGIILSFVSSQNLSIVQTNSNTYDNSQRKFRFRIEPISHGCGGILASHQGYFQSPNYLNDSNNGDNNIGFGGQTNHQYPPSMECVWTIKAIPDFHLEFEFNSRFDLEQADGCQNDYLLFEERRSLANIDEWTQISKLCGHQTPKTIISQSDLVRITFRSNDKIQGDGFRVQYRQKCGGQFEDESGIIYSPNYFTQGSYSNDLTCVYRIRRNPDEYVQIEFEEFDLEHHMNCLFDSVNIYLGDNRNSSTKYYGPYCGSLAPPRLVSNEMLTVVFHTDLLVTKRGFKARYNVTKCGGNITYSEGEIVSPSGFRHECVWNIIIPDERMSISLQIIELNMHNEHCRYDCCNNLKIMEDPNEIHHQQTLAFLCTNLTEEVTFKSTGNQMIIRLMHDIWPDVSMPQFRLRYWSSPGPKSNCGGHFDEKQIEGVIVTPDLNDDSFYEKQLDCIWTIHGQDENQIITLEFERFDVATTNDNGTDPNRCIHGGDYLEVFDGINLHAQQLAILCGRTMIPEKLTSSTNSMVLQFKTNLDDQLGHGFRAHFRLENRTCGGTILSTDTPTSLSSPQYPNRYERPLHCSWEIYSHFSFRTPLILKFQDLDLDCSRGDYVQILQFRQSAYESFLYSPITLCSSPTQIKFMTATNNRIRLIMKTFTDSVATEYDNIATVVNRTATVKLIPNQPKQTFRGFNLTHHFSICNESLDGPDNGFITNRNYPYMTQIHSNIFCYINITVPEDRQISLFFEQFQFYICSHSNLTIYDGNSGGGGGSDKKLQLFGTYCDQETIPNPLFTTTNRLSIIVQARFQNRIPRLPFNPHDNRNKILYSISYTSQPKSKPPGCGGNFTSLRGSFTSPDHPLPFLKDQSCVWMIHTNGYHTITLTFDEFMLAEPCDKNYVTIFDGLEDLDEKRLATFCSMVRNHCHNI